MTCGEWYSGTDVKAGMEVGRHSWFAVSFWQELATDDRVSVLCLWRAC